MELCVIHNPAAGRGFSRRRWRRIQRLLSSRADFLCSREPGHAEELAYGAANRGYATVAAAGGDGTVHEVANGVLRAQNPEVCFGVIPLGSGNDYAVCLELPADPDSLCKRLLSQTSRIVDVGEARDNQGRTRFFVNTLGLGLSGAVCYEAKRIRGLQGLPLYGLAAVQAICKHYRCHDAQVTIDEEHLDLRTLYLSVAVGQREGGGFIVAPDAKLDDGLFDYLHAGRVSRWEAVKYLPRMAMGRLPDNDPLVRRGQCRRLSVESPTAMLVHLDGELFAGPGDELRRLQIRILPGALSIRV